MAFILPVLEGVAEVMSAVTFVQFIEEESIQTCSLGIYLAIRARNFTAARQALNTLETVLIPRLKLVNASWGWLAPYSKFCFEDYVTACEAQIEVYKQLFTQGK